jgi:hypothetical protein
LAKEYATKREGWMRAEPAIPLWRPLLYYVIAVLGGTVYGGQV